MKIFIIAALLAAPALGGTATRESVERRCMDASASVLNILSGIVVPTSTLFQMKTSRGAEPNIVVVSLFFVDRGCIVTSSA